MAKPLYRSNEELILKLMSSYNLSRTFNAHTVGFFIGKIHKQKTLNMIRKYLNNSKSILSYIFSKMLFDSFHINSCEI